VRRIAPCRSPILAAHGAERLPAAWPVMAEFVVTIDKTIADPESAATSSYWPN
jgi:hypothetical protein